MDWTQIFVEFIIAGGAIGVAVINSNSNKDKIQKDIFENTKETKKSDLRSQIMFLILEDHDLVREGSLPENYKDIESLYDQYVSLGGNSHIKRKYKEYVEWYEGLQLKGGK